MNRTDKWIRSRSESKQKAAWVTYGTIQALRFELDPEGEASVTRVTNHMAYAAKKKLGARNAPSTATLQEEYRTVNWVIQQGADSFKRDISFGYYSRARAKDGATLEDLLKNPLKYKPKSSGTTNGSGLEHSIESKADSQSKGIITQLFNLHTRCDNEMRDLETEGEFSDAQRKKDASRIYLEARTLVIRANELLFSDED